MRASNTRNELKRDVNRPEFAGGYFWLRYAAMAGSSIMA